VNDELEKTRKEPLIAQVKYYPGICLRTKKTTQETSE